MDASSVFAAAIFASAALVLYRLCRRSGSSARSPLPYTRHSSLLTPCEKNFYHTLLYAIPDGYRVFVKVRLMDVVSVPDSAWREYGARGSGMHCDFVIADSSTLAIVLVIELDDRSHFSASARERDAFKDAALFSAGVPLLRVRAAGDYDAAWLRERLGEAVFGK